MGTSYDPTNAAHRARLAAALVEMLEGAKFTRDPSPEGQEQVWSFRHKNAPRAVVRVYTSVVGAQVRALDEDAIRVCMVYEREGGAVVPLMKARRVYRTGEVEGVVSRTLERMRSVYREFNDRMKAGHRCRHCGEPTFTSKKKNEVCAALCFTGARGASSRTPPLPAAS